MRKAARILLVLVSVINGVAGLMTGTLFIASPSGSLMGWEPLVSVVRTLPLADIFFRHLMWIGIAMLLVLAIPNAAAAVMLIRRAPGQYAACIIAGALLMLWTGFELVFMYNVAAVAYFMIGALSVLCAAWLHRGAAQRST